ncbi:MAG: hypothetical protein ABIP13_09140 [Tepidiformaceae bacterium]
MNSRLFALGIGASLFAACGSSRENGAGAGLGSQVCLQADVPGDFHRQTSGDFTPRNLADLSPSGEAHLGQLSATGLRGGHFAYWKQAVGAPPFDPPLDIVCQVLEFWSEDDASGFLAGIRPEPGDLATTALVWLPEGARAVTEEPSPLASSRAFAMRAEDSQTSVEISAVVLADGRFVRTVYFGGNGRHATAAEAGAIQQAMVTRLR